ncbi:MAG: acyl-CoA thioesterase [Bacillota bacterium]|nr:acyl-CoA thioesterase [Bacillota bacterium]
MEPYVHKVQYYETDRMGISHHSNYVRWMEEARIYYLDQIGWSYHKFEEEGIISPITSIHCDYKKTTTFMDKVFIEVSVGSFKGVKLILNYKMTNENGELVCTGSSESCFLNNDEKIVNMRREYPDFYILLNSLAEK